MPHHSAKLCFTGCPAVSARQYLCCLAALPESGNSPARQPASPAVARQFLSLIRPNPPPPRSCVQCCVTCAPLLHNSVLQCDTHHTTAPRCLYVLPRYGLPGPPSQLWLQRASQTEFLLTCQLRESVSRNNLNSEPVRPQKSSPFESLILNLGWNRQIWL